MSDNFLRVARKEIGDDLISLEQILSLCKNDIDISNNAKDIENRVHKIKGLAPMMGQINIGEIARLVDIVLKYIISNGTLEGTYKILNDSIKIMNEIFNNSVDTNIDEFKNKLQIFSSVLNK